MTDNLNPCKCGHEAQFCRVGYGRNHWSVCCTKCDQDVDADDSKRVARYIWNKANPQPTAEERA